MITVNESVLKWVQFVSIMLYVLVAGVMWGTWDPNQGGDLAFAGTHDDEL